MANIIPTGGWTTSSSPYTTGTFTTGNITYSPDYVGCGTTTIGGAAWQNTRLYPDYTRDPWKEIIERGIKNPEKEKSVKTEISDVVSKRRAKKIEKIVDEVEAVLDQIPSEDGYIVAWSAKFKTGDKVYRYAAIQSGGVWWVTNRTGSITRDQLLEMLVEQRMEATVEGLRWMSA